MTNEFSERIKLTDIKKGICIYSGGNTVTDEIQLSIDVSEFCEDSPSHRSDRGQIYLKIGKVREFIKEIENVLKNDKKEIDGKYLKIRPYTNQSGKKCIVCNKYCKIDKHLLIHDTYHIHFECLSELKNAIEDEVNSHSDIISKYGL